MKSWSVDWPKEKRFWENHTDSQIARMIGCSIAAAWHHRKVERLPKALNHYKHFVQKNAFNLERKFGWLDFRRFNDSELAKQTGFTRQYMAFVRRKLGFSPHPIGGKRRKSMEEAA